MTSAMSATGSAQRQGLLWGARGDDWALNEEQQNPTYEEAIRRAGISTGHRILEVGCGTGVFLRAASEEGAKVVGLDASESLLALARARVPAAELVVGDMQFLPFADDSFDAVLGFNSFFFAADMVAALAEARRVARAGAPVVIQVWGRPDHCDLSAMKRAVAALAPAPDAEAPAQPQLWQPGVLEQIVTNAGLTPREAFDVTWAYEFRDEETLAAAMLAPGLIVELIEHAGEAPVRRAIVESLTPYRMSHGGFRLENEWHTLIASA